MGKYLAYTKPMLKDFYLVSIIGMTLPH